MLLREHINDLQPNMWYILRSPRYGFKAYTMVCTMYEHGEVVPYFRYISPDGLIDQVHVKTVIMSYPDMSATLVDKVKIKITSEDHCKEQIKEYENDL